jgi:hypothetical protein
MRSQSRIEPCSSKMCHSATAAASRPVKPASSSASTPFNAASHLLDNRHRMLERFERRLQAEHVREPLLQLELGALGPDARRLDGFLQRHRRSTTFSTACATAPRMRLPPGVPSATNDLPARSVIVGDMGISPRLSTSSTQADEVHRQGSHALARTAERVS